MTSGASAIGALCNLEFLRFLGFGYTGTFSIRWPLRTPAKAASANNTIDLQSPSGSSYKQRH